MPGSNRVALCLAFASTLLVGCESTGERDAPGPRVRPAFASTLLVGCESTGERDAPGPRVRPAPRATAVPSTPAIAPSVSHPPTTPSGVPRRSVELDVSDALVTDVLESAARQVGVPFAALGSCAARVTVSLHQAPFADVVDYLARAGKLAVRYEGGVLVAVPRASTTIEASGASPSTWFRLLARQSGKSIVLPGHLEGAIDAELHDVDPLEALIVTARANGYEVLDSRGGIVQVGER